jgi:hypothetical protein
VGQGKQDGLLHRSDIVIHNNQPTIKQASKQPVLRHKSSVVGRATNQQPTSMHSREHHSDGKCIYFVLDDKTCKCNNQPKPTIFLIYLSTVSYKFIKQVLVLFRSIKIIIILATIHN